MNRTSVPSRCSGIQLDECDSADSRDPAAAAAIRGTGGLPNSTRGRHDCHHQPVRAANAGCAFCYGPGPLGKYPPAQKFEGDRDLSQKFD